MKQLSLLDCKSQPLQTTETDKNEQTVEILEECTNGVHCAVKKKPVAMLQGLYVIVRMPTEERLTARFEDLSKQNFEEIADLAETYMKDVDDKYKKKSNRGRSWKGTGRRAMSEGITGSSKRTVRFSPFPSSTLNIFKTLRKMRSDAYHKHCIVLERQEDKSFQNNINILPYANAPDFAQDLKLMNAKIDEANKSITDFLQTPEWQRLLIDLERYDVTDYLRRRSWTVEHCSLLVTDIALETATVKKHIEEEYRKMFSDIDEEKQRALDAVHEEFEKGQRSIAEQALESLRKEIGEIIKRILASSERKPERVKEDLERLRRKIVSIGLEPLESTVADLINVFDHPEQAVELFGTRDIEGAVDGRVQGLIDSLIT